MTFLFSFLEKMSFNHKLQHFAYNSIPESTPITMTVNSTADEQGIKVSIFKNIKKYKIPSPYHIHSSYIDKIYANTPESTPRDVAFIQICPQGMDFEPYDKEKIKMVVTLKAYINILTCFNKYYSTWQEEIAVFKAESNGIHHEGTISYGGHASMHMGSIIEETPDFQLKVDFCFNYGKNTEYIILFYSFKEFETVILPPLGFLELASDLSKLNNLLKYKDVRDRKRSRQ